MNFKTHAPARREGTTLQPNIHISPIPFSEFLLGGKKIYINNDELQDPRARAQGGNDSATKHSQNGEYKLLDLVRRGDLGGLGLQRRSRRARGRRAPRGARSYRPGPRYKTR